jgi:hypothetical protein
VTIRVASSSWTDPGFPRYRCPNVGQADSAFDGERGLTTATSR